MPLCCCRRRRTNRVEEADTKTRNQETLHYTHRDGVVTVTREYSHPSLRGTVTQRTYKCMDDVRLDSRQAASQLARAASILGWGADPFANGREVTVQGGRGRCSSGAVRRHRRRCRRFGACPHNYHHHNLDSNTSYYLSLPSSEPNRTWFNCGRYVRRAQTGTGPTATNSRTCGGGVRSAVRQSQAKPATAKANLPHKSRAGGLHGASPRGLLHGASPRDLRKRVTIIITQHPISRSPPPPRAPRARRA